MEIPATTDMLESHVPEFSDHTHSPGPGRTAESETTSGRSGQDYDGRYQNLSEA
jgi:hypothetical protein